MNCKEPFLELAKVKKAYDEQQEKMNKLLGKLLTAKIGKVVESEQANTKTNPPVMQDSLTVISNDYLAVSHQPIHLSKETQQQKEISSKRLMKAQQFRVKEVLKRVMEATKEEEDLFVGFVKKSSLTMSKSLFIDGKVTNNKKLLIKFLKDSIIAKHMVLGETIKTQFLLQPHRKLSIECLTEKIPGKYFPCITVSNMYQYAVESLKNSGFQYVNSTITKTSTKMERQCFIQTRHIAYIIRRIK